MEDQITGIRVCNRDIEKLDAGSVAKPMEGEEFKHGNL
jgi:hypothetical protein